MKVIGYTTSFILLAALGVTLSGYALSILWGWFFVPIFQVPVLNIPSAIGLALIASYLTHQDNTDLSTKNEGMSDVLLQGCVKAIVRPAAALFAGWIVTFWL